jgi:CubicO group peptidase (beta-lactamase class C family)
MCVNIFLDFTHWYTKVNIMQSLQFLQEHSIFKLIAKYFLLTYLFSCQLIAAENEIAFHYNRTAFGNENSEFVKNSAKIGLTEIVQIESEILIEEEEFLIQLPDGKRYYAVATSVQQLDENNWSWNGTLSSEANDLGATNLTEGAANFTIVDGLTAGLLTLPHVTYKLIPYNETESFAQKVDSKIQSHQPPHGIDNNAMEAGIASNSFSYIGLKPVSRKTSSLRTKRPISNNSTVSTKKAQKVTKYFYKTANITLIEGGGEFILKFKKINVPAQQRLTFEWTTTSGSAVNGRWEVKNLSTSNIVASGIVSAAPKPGHVSYFTLPSDAFLVAEPPQVNISYQIRIIPLDSEGKAIGAGSGVVTITQLSPDNIAPPTKFGDGAKFPKIELVSYSPKMGQVPLTQLYYEYADVKVRVRNMSKEKTDPMWFTVKDNSLLFRQNGLVSLPELYPGQSVIREIRLNAILPPAKSQTPGAEQHKQWMRQYDNMCGAELRSFLEWRGPSSQTPLNATQERFLVTPEWEDYAILPPNRLICDNGQCVKTCAIEKNIRNMLDGRTVGYSFFLGQWPHSGGSGAARKGKDGDLPFTAQTKMTVASVSKLITAIGALRILDMNNIAITDQIGPYLPGDWDVDPYLASVTFAQLLSQRSGIMDYGNVNMTFDQLQFFFEQDLDPNAQPACNGPSAAPRAQPVDQSAPGNCYSNYNTGLFRIILPRVAGLAIDTNPTTRAQTYADQYEVLINQNVFARVGVAGTACRPVVSSPHAFAYNFGSGEAGMDWGDVSDQCGAAGWYLSVEDMGRVLLSINARDGKILRETPRFPGDPVPSQYDQLRTMGLGLDNNGPDWIEKNGGWSGCNGNGGCGSIATTAAIFGAGALPNPNLIGVLFTNSDIKYPVGCEGNDCLTPRAILRKAYDDALIPQ